MKNRFKFALITAAIISLPLVLSINSSSTVEAKAGACSGHRGVNCAAGPDRDGSVICNDGWKRSTVTYKSMAMCKKKK